MIPANKPNGQISPPISSGSKLKEFRLSASFSFRILRNPLEPWDRIGGLGAYSNLIGTGEANDAYIYEIPPGQKGREQHHLYEETIYVISGHGATSIWQTSGKRKTFEWQTGSLVSPPDQLPIPTLQPAAVRNQPIAGVTNAPVLLNLFHNADFVFNNNYVFSDRFSSWEEYFSGKGDSFPGRI